MQQSLPRELDAVAVDREHPITLMAEPLIAPFVENFDAKLAAEVAGVEIAPLKLQNHLSHQKLMRRGTHRAIERQSIALEQVADVVVPFGFVLIMDARDVPEA